MESSSIDNAAAKHILKRVCNAISIVYSTKVYPYYYKNGIVSIVTDDKEIAAVKLQKAPFYCLYFNGACDLLLSLTTMDTILRFSPLGKDKVEIETSKMFGESIDEMKIRLDLLNV